jgi:hypothetical protein
MKKKRRKRRILFAHSIADLELALASSAMPTWSRASAIIPARSDYVVTSGRSFAPDGPPWKEKLQRRRRAELRAANPSQVRRTAFLKNEPSGELNDFRKATQLDAGLNLGASAWAQSTDIARTNVQGLELVEVA